MTDIRDIYNSLTGTSVNLRGSDIEEHFPTVTASDRERGTITRYFTRQVNHRSGYISEISATTYGQLKSNRLYKIAELTWRVSGDQTAALTANQRVVDLVEIELPGIRSRLVNFLQFWK
jgi:hypothetical protein